jgi:FO synthase
MTVLWKRLDDVPDDHATAWLFTTARQIWFNHYRKHKRRQLARFFTADTADVYGVDDWGGVSPLTPDHVNPERPWPHLDSLRQSTAAAGFALRPRLTVHPRYVLGGEWIDPRVRPYVEALADGRGLLADDARPIGLPWQEPDADAGGYAEFAARSAGGRVDLHIDIDIAGRGADRRADFADVYGDWEEVSERARDLAGMPPRLAPDLRRALQLSSRAPRERHSRV